MGITERVIAAARAFVAGRPLEQPTTQSVIASLVRSFESNVDINLTEQQKAAKLLSLYSGTAATCANIRSKAVASVPWRLYRKARKPAIGFIPPPPVPQKKLDRMKRLGGYEVRKALAKCGNLEEITDENHQAMVLMSKPWPGGDTFGLLTQTELCLTFAGNFYWLIVLDAAGFPCELWPGHPSQTRVVANKETFIGAYINGRGRENEKAYKPNLVVHFKGVNPMGDPFYGRGEVESIMVPIQLEAAIDQFAMSTLTNGVTPGARIMPESGKTFSTETAQAIRDELRSKHEGTDNGARSLVFKAAVQYQESNLGEKELAFQQALKDARERIANTMNVPMGFLTMDQSALATAAAATPLFQKLAITPRCQALEDTINAQLMCLFSEKLGYDVVFCFDHAEESENREDRATRVTAAGGAYLTVNEVRKEEGLPPIADGDTLAKPAAPTAGGGLFGMFGTPNAPPAAATAPLALPPAKPPDLSTAAEAPPVGKTLEGMVCDSVACCDHAPRTRAAAMMRKDEKRTPWDIPGTLSKAESDLVAQVIEWLARVQDSLDPEKIAATGIVDIAGKSNLLASFQMLTEKPLGVSMLLGQNVGATEGPVKVDIVDVLTAPVREQLAAYQLDLADDVLQRAEAGIRQALTEVVGRAGTLAEQITAIREVVPSASGYVAERIARTETARSFCNGRENGWQTTGSVTGKKWLLSGNPCKLCRALNGRIRELKEPFALAGETLGGIVIKRTIDNPPGHPNCSCDIGAVWDEAGRAGVGNQVDKA